MPRFAGVPTFLRLPITAEEGPVPKVDVLLCGVPLDAGTNFRAGARFGPRAVRDASALSRRFSAALGVDIYEELEVADGGDVAVTPHDIGQALSSVAARAESIVRSGAVGGFVGGDQTVTLGVLRGIHRAKLRSVGLLHIDAHSNTCRSSWGQDVHHESVIRNAVEEGLVRPDRVLQMGIRGPYSSAEDMDFALSSGFEIVKIDDLRWDLHGAISQLRRFVGQGSIYVSVDVCALDPAFAPGVGTPSPGGMSTWELQQILRALVGAEIVGFDLVEIAPSYDRTGVTALAGVSILQEILAALADTRRSARSAPSSRAPGSVRRGRRRSA
jgi:agmatinase